MSYVWSDGLRIEVGGEMVQIVSVTISADKTNPKVGEPIHVYVNFEANQAPTEDVDVEVVLALNSKSNIIKRTTSYLLAGQTRGSAGFVVSFNQEGSYILYGGARII